jgi:putative ABC transport system permease protein
VRAASICREAAQALRFNRQRSILTTISLAWGVACFVILNGYGDGFHRALLRAFRSQGQDLVLVFGGRTSTQAGGERAGRRIQLERTDVEAIREAAPMIAAISPEMMMRGSTVVHGYREHTMTVRGVHTEYGRVRNQTMAAGRWIVPRMRRRSSASPCWAPKRRRTCSARCRRWVGRSPSTACDSP